MFHKGIINNHRKKKLMEVDTTFSINRHITAVSVGTFMQSFIGEINIVDPILDPIFEKDPGLMLNMYASPP